MVIRNLLTAFSRKSTHSTSKEDDELFERFFNESFPSVSAETRSKFKSFLSKDFTEQKWLYKSQLRSDISQGDICIAIPAFFLEGDNIKKSTPCPFILLEHTCDMSVDNGAPRNSNYIFAPLLPYAAVKKHVDTDKIIKNMISHKIYFHSPPKLDGSYVADLNMIGSIGSEWFHNSIKEKIIKRVASLSDVGFYFLLAKLTAHMMRAN